MSTGFPDADARDDFSRVQRERALERLWSRLRRRPQADQILLFEDATRALGRRGQRDLGLQVIAVASIIGTIDRAGAFDRKFRPTSTATKERWQRLAAAVRRGQALPPIDVYRVGDLHFVRDGHHRVSVARAVGQDEIDAYVTEVLTLEPTALGTGAADLPLPERPAPTEHVIARLRRLRRHGRV